MYLVPLSKSQGISLFKKLKIFPVDLVTNQYLSLSALERVPWQTGNQMTQLVV